MNTPPAAPDLPRVLLPDLPEFRALSAEGVPGFTLEPYRRGEVPAGSAAARAGLRGSLRNSKGQLLAPLGDIIVAVDGVRVQNSFDVTRLVAAKRPGQKVTLRVWRNKKAVDVPVTLLKRTLR